ncbi:CLUMA_CG019623, isoform A [Clunio marinus]|uniref:lysozyme n=1 Tax=Clunio marinus TaxID=568069 RepID=A0A1J1J534_9DIPT|nr:CLUMA_CG019623, isoform A [Clunio marinus]
MKIKILNLRIIVVIFAGIYFVDAKVYQKCELALELRDKHFIPLDRIGVLVCIAERQSNLNTAAVGDGTYFGMYQLSSEYWCERNYAGKACNVQCSSLTDNDITDDLNCVQIIYDEHQRLFNNGFNAWPSSQYCQSQGNDFIQECFIEDNQIIKPLEITPRQSKKPGNISRGKVYDRCDLARELYYQHDIAMKDVATWVCIANYESAFDTSAIGRLNWDGSNDHGLFQISDIYWCGDSGKSCGLKCTDLRDNDITDDVKCIKTIHAEHQRISGDGFTAWAVYPRCKGQQSKRFADGCFDASENEIMPYRPRPGVQQPQKNYASVTQQRKQIEVSKDAGKIYERCELAQELRYKFNIPMEDVATWVCIAKHESGFNTSAIGRLNADGSEDHGLFQISDIYWCSPPGRGKGCGLTCSQLEDSDISDDVECMLKIHDEHRFLSGDGFNAWAVYRPYCQGRSQSYIDGCFTSNDIVPRPAITQPTTTRRTTTVTTAKKTTKTTTRVPTTSTRTTTTRAPTTKPTTRAPVTIKKAPAVTTVVKKPTTSQTSKPPTTTRQVKTTPKSVTTKTTTKQKSTTTASKATTKVSIKLPDKTQRPVENPKTTVKPFNIFDLYFNSIGKGSLANNDVVTSQRIAVREQKQSKTTKVPQAASIKPSISTTRSSSSTSKASNINPEITTTRQDFNVNPTLLKKTTRTSSIGSLSIYNALQDYSVNSNRIGRVVENITPHSFDYLLTLTTPRTPFKRL